MNRSEIKHLIVSARKQQVEATEKTQTLIDRLDENLDVKLDDLPCDIVYNANTLEEAILCHIAYGEGDIEKLLDDIMEVLNNAK